MENKENLYTCENCGRTLNEEEAFIIDGEIYCEDCESDLFAICEECGTRVKIVTMEQNREGEFICEDCIDDHYLYCAECGELINANEEEYIIADDEIFCEDCAEDELVETWNGELHRRYDCTYNEFQDIYIWDYGEYDTCNNCGAMYIEELLEETDPHAYVCGECLNEQRRNNKGAQLDLLYSYDANEYNINLLHNEGIGIEFEIGHVPDAYDFEEVCERFNILTIETGSRSTSLLTAEKDCSVAAEIKTIILNLEEAMEIIPELGTALKEIGCKAHDYEPGAGLHMHLSRTLFNNENHMRNYVQILHDNKEFIKTFSRRTDAQLYEWCKIPAHMPKSMLWKRLKGDRYHYINIMPKNTIEIRINRSTLKANTLKATILFFYNLIEYSKHHTNFKKYVEVQAAEHEEIKQYLEERGLLY